MANPSEAEIIEKLGEVLAEGDFAEMTIRQVMKKLEDHFKCDLTDRKKLVRDEVDRRMQEAEDGSGDDERDNPEMKIEAKTAVKKEQASSDADSDHVSAPKRKGDAAAAPGKRTKAAKVSDESDAASVAEEEKDEGEEDQDSDRGSLPRRASRASSGRSGRTPVKARASFSQPLKLSSDLAEFVNESHMSRADVMRFIRSYATSNGLLDAKNRNKILCDEALKNLVGVDSMTDTTMAKYLSKHFPSTAPAGKKEKTKKTGEKRSSVFSKQLMLHPQLAEVLKVQKASRGDVVKLLNQYFKDNNLQDPKNRKILRLDDKLQAVFKRASFTYFTMNKYLSKLLFTPEEVG
eukprot:CAMPEP_0196657550 /NCGR_PEP_ID=MMETSP1086-20130531/24130_1 /TAXON_ID=77921 /ORGANISM="Cyanoptyche  gloeocystis , Strain SAG4.97" /LENGTH=347 /DNA_ID=CAMNT_0041990731 /DNA_START=39 /DNA_END=1082 /DNA_ORIENTATION=-